MVVEVDRRSVLGQEREPDVVGRRDCPAERVLVDVADLEIFEETPAPALFDSHFSLVIMRHVGRHQSPRYAFRTPGSSRTSAAGPLSATRPFSTTQSRSAASSATTTSFSTRSSA